MLLSAVYLPMCDYWYEGGKHPEYWYVVGAGGDKW